MKQDFLKIGIVGGGPAGYALALKLAMGGVSVTLFEKEALGGTCLNKGCIPTKSILHNSNLIYKSKNLSKYGVNVDVSALDFSKIIENKNSIVQKLNKSLAMMLKSYDIEIVNEDVLSVEQGKIISKNTTCDCDAVVLATGTVPAQIPGLECDNVFIYNSDGILNLSKLPKSIAIIGSGAIGIEWSRIFSDLGTEVTLIEAMERILPVADEDVSLRLERLLKKKRVKIEKGVVVEKILDGEVKLSNGKSLSPELVLVAIGRTPVLPSNNLNLAKRKGFVCVDNNFMTSAENIYAIGDINGLSMLAHSATHQAIELSEYLLSGKSPEFMQKDIPSVIYGTPEVAWFGANEKHLIETNINYKKVLFPISAIGKAHTDEEIDGFVKVLACDEQIEGVSIVAPEASAMLMQFLLAKENKLPYKSVINSIFPHPTFSEAVFESLLALDNESLSLPKSKE